MECRFELGAIQLEKIRLMRRVFIFCMCLPRCTVTPSAAEKRRKLARRHAIAFLWSDIIPDGELRLFPLFRRNHEVGCQRLKNVLIGTRGLWIAHLDGAPGSRRADAVRHDAIGREIPTADDVAGTGCRDGAASIREKAFHIAMCDKFATALAVRIGIIAVEWLVLSIAPAPFLVFVDLICRYIEQGAHALCLARALEDMDGAHPFVA